MTFDSELGECDLDELISPVGARGPYRPIYVPAPKRVGLTRGQWIGYGVLFMICAAGAFSICAGIWLMVLVLTQ